MSAGALGQGPGLGQSSCGCGKLGWTSRKAAKRAARVLHPADRLSVYQCAVGRWHYGHLPRAVQHGDFDRRTMARMRGQL